MNKITLELDTKAKALTANYLRTEGELLSVLMDMRKRRVFAELNCMGIFDYCERVLKLSKAQAYYFKTVAEASERVPPLKEAVKTGELSISKARRIAPVITPQNQAHWIQHAKELTQDQLEKEVAAANPKAHTKEKIKPLDKEILELKVPIDGETEANLLALKDILSQKLGRNATLSDVVAFAAQETRMKFDPMEKAKRARKVSSGKSASPKDKRQIPAAVRHQVMKRDGNQCTYIGPDGNRCTQRRFLHYHHIKPVSDGGESAARNVQLFCFAHHRAWHQRKDYSRRATHQQRSDK